MFTLAAGDTFFESLPIATFAAYAMNALPIWRKKFDSRDIQPLRRRLVEGPCGYILFPEGTRTRTGEIGRFRRGIGMLTAGTDVPIVPCHLKGAFEAFPPGRPFPRPVRMGLSIGSPLRFPGVANDANGWSIVAAKLEEAVRGLAR
jgi:1-acyl-sn-glycerol-3-phosphate acyltransferase